MRCGQITLVKQQWERKGIVRESLQRKNWQDMVIDLIWIVSFAITLCCSSNMKGRLFFFKEIHWDQTVFINWGLIALAWAKLNLKIFSQRKAGFWLSVQLETIPLFTSFFFFWPDFSFKSQIKPDSWIVEDGVKNVF